MKAIQAKTGSATVATLWRRAPAWRGCFILALLSSGLVILFPPVTIPSAGAGSQPPLAEAATFNPPPRPAAVSHALPSAPAATTVAARVSGSPQSGARDNAAVRLSAANPRALAPVNAQIALALPGPSNTSDPSGLDSALLGKTYSGSVTAGGFDVSLPPGRWALLANSSLHVPKAVGSSYFFGRIEHKRLVGAVSVFAVKSAEKPGDGFPKLNTCVDGNPNHSYLFVDALVPFDHQGCWFISNIYTTPMQQWADRAIKLAPLGRAAAGDMAAKGVSYPQDFVNVQFARSEKWGVLEVSY